MHLCIRAFEHSSIGALVRSCSCTVVHLFLHLCICFRLCAFADAQSCKPYSNLYAIESTHPASQRSRQQCQMFKLKCSATSQAHAYTNAECQCQSLSQSQSQSQCSNGQCQIHRAYNNAEFQMPMLKFKPKPMLKWSIPNTSSQSLAFFAACRRLRVKSLNGVTSSHARKASSISSQNAGTFIS